MLNVLHRTDYGPVILDRPTRDEPLRSPPPPVTPPGREPGSPWPASAKVIVAVLAVLALAGAVGMVIGFSSGDDAATPEPVQETVDDLSAEGELLRAARDEALARVESLEAELAAVESELDEVLAERDELEAADAASGVAIVELEAQLDAREADLASVSADLRAAEGDLAAAEADLQAQVALTAAATTERDALRALFPLTVESGLEGADLAGDYDVDITAVYCEGFADCSVLPRFDELTIVETSQGWLRVEIDGYVDAGLFAADGSLFAVAESTTAVPGCAGSARIATVSMTMYAHGLTVSDDGSRVIDDLGASLMVQSPQTGSCARGLAFYGLALDPAG